VHTDVMTREPSQAENLTRRPDSEQRQRAVIAATALIGLGVFFLLQQAFSFGAQLIVLALGIGFYAAHVNRGGQSNLIVPAGILTGLGLGIALVSDNVTPGNIHGPLMLGSLALGFGIIYFLGDARHSWAMWPMAVCGVLAVFVLVVSDPFRLGMAFPEMRLIWPLLLIAAGVWVLKKDRW
jgi:hypothetical protein